MSFFHGLVEVLLTPTLISEYAIPAAVLNGDWLQIQILEPGNYQAQWESEGASQVETTFSGTYPVASPQRYSFTIDVKDPRQSLRLALEELAEASTSSLLTNTFVPVQVRDYCNPEREAYKASIISGNRPFTLRNCIIYKTDQSVVGNIVQGPSTNLKSTGWSMTFREINLKNP